MVQVTLDGSLSYDPDDALADLQYLWTLDTQPEGATVTFEGAETANPTFSADLLGDYVFSLVVTDADGLVSEPAYAMVSVVPYEYMIVNLSWDVTNLDLDLHLFDPQVHTILRATVISETPSLIGGSRRPNRQPLSPDR